jgi:hypothetical protein
MEVSLKDYVKEFKKKLWYVYLLACVIFLFYMIYSSKNVEKMVLRYKFNGIAEKVVYDGKNIPSVTIKGATYYLGSGYWNFNHLISKGDSLKKDSGDIAIKLIKHGNGRVLIFDGSKYYEK